MILPLSTFLGNGKGMETLKSILNVECVTIAILMKNQIENFRSLDLPATYLFDLLLWLLENGPSMRQ